MTQPMSSQLGDQWLESQNPATQQRVTMAMIRQSQAVSEEPADTPNHSQRVLLAQAVARNPTMFTQPFTLLVVAQGFNSSGDDGTLMDWMRQVWDTMAGQPQSFPPNPQAPSR